MIASSPAQTLRPESAAAAAEPDVARFLLSTPPGCFRALVGLTPQEIRSRLDEATDDEHGRVALIVPIESFFPAEAVIEEVTAALAETAARMWPSWHGRRDPGAISQRWVRRAEARAGRGASPRPRGFPREVELAQLCLVLHPRDVALVVSPARPPAPREAASLLHALEWIAHHANLPVLLALEEAPADDPAFDRALSAALVVATRPAPAPERAAPAALAPVHGEPHPLSEVERRIARALRADAELGALFGFNRLVRTLRGSTPKVDLLWEGGRLVVEFDGYADHGGREAFARDRHRDYELTLSGYTVLRIANDEVLEDVEKAIEKIRDLVRSRTAGGDR